MQWPVDLLARRKRQRNRRRRHRNFHLLRFRWWWWCGCYRRLWVRSLVRRLTAGARQAEPAWRRRAWSVWWCPMEAGRRRYPSTAAAMRWAWAWWLHRLVRSRRVRRVQRVLRLQQERRERWIRWMRRTQRLSPSPAPARAARAAREARAVTRCVRYALQPAALVPAPWVATGGPRPMVELGQRLDSVVWRDWARMVVYRSSLPTGNWPAQTHHHHRRQSSSQGHRWSNFA